MTEDKRCKTCEYYIAGRGRYRTGLCTSNESKKHSKDFILSGDYCKCWKERSTNE